MSFRHVQAYLRRCRSLAFRLALHPHGVIHIDPVRASCQLITAMRYSTQELGTVSVIIICAIAKEWLEPSLQSFHGGGFCFAGRFPAAGLARCHCAHGCVACFPLFAFAAAISIVSCRCYHVALRHRGADAIVCGEHASLFSKQDREARQEMQRQGMHAVCKRPGVGSGCEW